MKKLSKKNIKHFSRQYAKSKAGATLIEMVAVIAILAITSTSCLGAMFSMVDVSKKGQQVSESQRICALLGEQFLLYGNTATFVQSRPIKQNFVDMGAYTTLNPGGLMDANNPSGNHGTYNEFLVSASPSKQNTILFERFDTTTAPHSFDGITSIDKIKRIDFTVRELSLPYLVATNVGKKYVLEYTIKTIYDYKISGGVVLNNTTKSTVIVELGGNATGSFSIVADPTEPDYATCQDNVLRIQSTNRAEVDRD